MKRKRVLTFAFVSNNVGDDLFLHVLSRRYPDVDFYVSSKARHNQTLSAHPNLKLCRRNYLFDKMVGLEQRLRAKGMHLSLLSWAAKLMVKPFKIALFIAGSVFVENGKGGAGTIRRNLARATAAKRFYVVSANFGPYTTPSFRDGMADCFRHAEDICFRDSWSQEQFKRMENIRWAPDAVFTLPVRQAASKHQVMISTLNLARKGRPAELRAMEPVYEQKVQAMAALLMDQGYRVCLASFCENQGDGVIADRLCEALKADGHSDVSVLHYNGDLDELLNEVAASDLVIATRFHAMLLGWLHGKRVMPIRYNAKMDHVLADTDFWPGYDALALDQLDPEEAVNTLLRQPIPDCTKLCERAQDQFRALDKALGRKRWQPTGKNGSIFEQMMEDRMERDQLSVQAMNGICRLTHQPEAPDEAVLPEDQDTTLVSVVIPTHNRLDMLIRAVDSVLMQTHRSVQIIVVDDASTDDTQTAFPARYSAEPRVEYMRNEKSLGPGGARQAGYLRAKGSYIIYLDDDDFYLEPRFFEKAVAVYREQPTCSMVCANAIVYNVDNDLPRFKALNFEGFLEKEKYFVYFISMYDKPYSSFPTMFRVSALEQADFRSMTMMNDMSIYLRALCFGDAYALPDIIGVYLQHKANISKALPHEFLLENLREKKHIWELARVQFDLPLDDWFRTQIMASVRYYFCGSKVTYAQKKEVFDWCKANCPNMHFALVKTFIRSYLGRLDPNKIRAKLALQNENKK